MKISCTYFKCFIKFTLSQSAFPPVLQVTKSQYLSSSITSKPSLARPYIDILSPTPDWLLLVLTDFYTRGSFDKSIFGSQLLESVNRATNIDMKWQIGLRPFNAVKPLVLSFILWIKFTFPKCPRSPYNKQENVNIWGALLQRLPRQYHVLTYWHWHQISFFYLLLISTPVATYGIMGNLGNPYLAADCRRWWSVPAAWHIFNTASSPTLSCSLAWRPYLHRPHSCTVCTNQLKIYLPGPGILWYSTKYCAIIFCQGEG